jgi:hypothetical protein
VEVSVVTDLNAEINKVIQNSNYKKNIGEVRAVTSDSEVAKSQKDWESFDHFIQKGFFYALRSGNRLILLTLLKAEQTLLEKRNERGEDPLTITLSALGSQFATDEIEYTKIESYIQIAKALIKQGKFIFDKGVLATLLLALPDTVYQDKNKMASKAQKTLVDFVSTFYTPAEGLKNGEWFDLMIQELVKNKKTILGEQKVLDHLVQREALSETLNKIVRVYPEFTNIAGMRELCLKKAREYYEKLSVTIKPSTKPEDALAVMMYQLQMEK